MKAIILTAGEGAHFYPLTVTRPKGMSIVAGKPILQHTVEALVAAGITECWFVVGYKPERIRTFFGNGSNFGMQAHYVVQERPQGIGAAIALAATEMRPTEETLVVYGDNHYAAELVQQVRSIPGNVVLGHPVSQPPRNGLLLVKGGRLTGVESPPTSPKGLENVGVMKFTPEFFQLLRAKGNQERRLVGAFQEFVEGGGVINVPTVDHGFDVAEDVWELLRMNERLLQDLPDGVRDIAGVRVEGKVVIGPNTIIRPGAQLLGPLYIGSDCEIRENAIVGPYASLRNNVHVGSNSEIRNAIINNNVFIDSQCIVRFSILDDGVSLGPFSALYEGRTGRAEATLPSRHGAVVGPDTTLGARTTVKPGSIIGPEIEVDEGSVVGSIASPVVRS